MLDTLGEKLLLLLLFLDLFTVTLLQPAVGRDISIVVLVFAHCLKVLSNARDLGRATLLWRVVDWFNPAQRRARGEQVQ